MFGGKGEYFTNYQSVSKSFTLKPDMVMSIFLTYVFVHFAVVVRRKKTLRMLPRL